MAMVVFRRLVADSWELRQFSVDTVGSDGTVNLRYGEGTIDSVPCADAYPSPAAGDKVWVARSKAGVMEVLTKSNS